MRSFPSSPAAVRIPKISLRFFLKFLCLLMMRMQLKVLLLPWISLLPPAEIVPAGAAPFQLDSSTGNLPLHAETSSKWVETQYTKADTAALLGDDSITWKESSEQRAAHVIEVRDEGAPEGSRPGTLRRAFRPLVSYKKLGISLALLLCIGFFSASLMRRPTPKEQEEYDRKQEARTRLEKVKALFPAAKELALVVNSAGSHALLRKVEDILAENDLAPPETTEVERFEALLADALKALRRLHRVAIEEAAAVVQDDKTLPDFSTLGLPPEGFKDVLLGLEQHSEHQTVRPLARTYRSLFDSDVTLTKQYQDSAMRLFSQRPFKGENDADVLVKTAASFKALRAIRASRRRLCEVGREVGKDVVESAKLTLLGRRNHALRDIEGDLQMLRVRCSLAKNAADADADPAEADTLTPVQEQKLWVALERTVEAAESSLAQLRSNAEVLRASTTLAAATAANKYSFEAEERARYLLEQCDDIEASLPGLPEHIDPKTSILLHEMARSNVGIVLDESTSLLESLQRIRASIVKEGRWSVFLEPLNKFIITNLVQQAEVIGLEGRERADHSGKLAKDLERVKKTQRALDRLGKSRVDVVFQTGDSMRMRTLELCSRLAVFLEEDMDYTVNQAGKAASQSTSLSGQEKQEYEVLQRKYDAAKRSAVDARNVLEAAEAAAEMRACTFKMQGLFFAPGGKEG